MIIAPTSPTLIGIDAHPSSITAVVLTPLGKQIETLSVKNTKEERNRLIELSQKHHPSVFVIENARAFALPLTQEALEQKIGVYDVPASRIASIRKRRSADKNDCLDAKNAVMCYLQEPSKYQPVKLNNKQLEIRSYQRTRSTLVRLRVKLEQQLKAMSLQSFTPPEVLMALEACIQTLKVQIKLLEKQIKSVMKEYKTLLETTGISWITASVLIGEVHDIKRFSNEDAFAAYAGIAPKDYSSGLSTRVRVNRGGNKRLKGAIDTITVSRVRWDEVTKTYFAKKVGAGMRKRQAYRATRRVVCRMVFRLLEKVLT